MKLPVKWLAEFVDIDVQAKTYAEKMTMSGSKIETIEYLGEEIKNVVVGKITHIEKHPNADKLQICMLDVGGASDLQIVTGAKNVAVGDYVPVALDNSKLPGGIEIKAGKLRGVDSFGMLCSFNELGMTVNNFPGAAEDGILILDDSFAPGTDICEAVGLDDTVFEFEITPNRPDCLCVIGLARETAATFSLPLKIKKPQVKGCGESIDGRVSVTVKDKELCRRYTAAVVCDVDIKPSPKWMRERLHAAGVRPINNIVDITNYVMLEYGQPMHAFDFACIQDGDIIVRRANKGETLETLDGQSRELRDNMLVIADKRGPVAVAGVMGGANSEITDTTTTVIFESAVFDAPSVRITARNLGMRTDASSRFEKGLDPRNTMPAIERACQLVEELGAGRVLSGFVDVDNSDAELRRVEFAPDRINALLGTKISREDMVKYLTTLGFEIDGDYVVVPSWRADVEAHADVAEEVARLYGYDRITSAPLFGKNMEGGYDKEQMFGRSLSAISRAFGYSECVSFSFINPKNFDLLALSEDDALRKVVRIKNPLGDETSVMRTTMLPSILELLGRNYSYRNAEARLFEIGSVYLPALDENGTVLSEKLPEERPAFVLGEYGKDSSFFTLKGAVETILSSLSVGDVSFVAEKTLKSWHPGQTARVYSGDKFLGIIGTVHPKVSSAFGIDAPAYVAELDMHTMFECINVSETYRPLPKFPATTRDIAVVCDKNIPVADIEKCIKKAIPDILESIELFDIYTGAQVEDGKKSVAYSIRLRSEDHTLKDSEADSAVAAALSELSVALGASLRA